MCALSSCFLQQNVEIVDWMADESSPMRTALSVNLSTVETHTAIDEPRLTALMVDSRIKI
jgi:hypothetical protein